MAEEHADEPTTYWRPEPPCRCDVARGECHCWEDDSTGEPREFEGRVPEVVTAEKPNAPDCSEARLLARVWSVFEAAVGAALFPCSDPAESSRGRAGKTTMPEAAP